MSEDKLIPCAQVSPNESLNRSVSPSNQLLHVPKMWIFEQIVSIIHIGSKHGFDVLNGKKSESFDGLFTLMFDGVITYVTCIASLTEARGAENAKSKNFSRSEFF